MRRLPYNKARAAQGGVGGASLAPPTPPSAARAALAGPRSPAQLTSFCPAPLGHLGKPANGLRGREIQRSTSCNPRILQGRGMFDGKAFLLGEGFSRGGSLFSIIFKLWYKRTPLTGKPRHERPPLPPQICLGYVLKMYFLILRFPCNKHTHTPLEKGLRKEFQQVRTSRKVRPGAPGV